MNTQLPAKRTQVLPVMHGPWAEKPNPLYELFYVLFRHKRKVLAFFAASALLGSMVSALIPSTYTSQGKLLVQRGRENLSLEPTALGTVVPIWKDWNYELNSEYEILTSRELSETVVRRIGAEKLVSAHHTTLFTQLRRAVGIAAPPAAPSVGRAVEALRAGLQIEVVRKSDIITVSYTTSDPDLAQPVVSEIIQAYLDKHIAVRRNDGAYGFLKKQVDSYQDALAKTETSLRALQNEMGITSLEGKRNIDLNRVSILREQEERTAAKLAASRARIGALRDMLGTSSNSVPAKSVRLRGVDYADIESALVSEKINLASLLGEARSLDNAIANDHVTYMVPINAKSLQDRRDLLRRETAASQGKIEGLETLIRNETKKEDGEKRKLTFVDYDDIQSALWSEEANLASHEAEQKVVKAQIAETEAEIAVLNGHETRIRWLERNRDDLLGKYLKYRDAVEEARINAALEEEKMSNIKVVQGATMPLGRNPSQRLPVAAAGLLLGMFGSVLLAFGAERVDHTISRPDDVGRELQLPLLGSIPLSKKTQVFHDRNIRKGKHSQQRLQRIDEIPFDTRRHLEPLASSVLNSVRLPPDGPSLIGLTSCMQGEGVSSVAANLAVTLARHAGGDGVLLVDANCGSASSPHNVKLKELTGIWNICVDRRGAITVAEHNLYTQDEDAASPSESISHDDILRHVREHPCSIAVLDLPPVGRDITALDMAKCLDHVAIVVEAERVHAEDARETKEMLERSGANVIGIILNKRRSHVPSWLCRKL